MPYSQDSNKEIIDKDEQRLHQQLYICQGVKNVVESEGFKNTISPLIDKMIMDTIGGKIGDTWIGGKVDRARTEEKREFYLGYKQALVDLHNRIFFHIQELVILEERIKAREEDKKVRYRIPMVDDTRYRPEE